MTTQPQKRPFTVDECDRMVAAAILTEEDRVELIAARRRPFTVGEYYRMAEPFSPRRIALSLSPGRSSP